MTKILLIEDEPALAETLEDRLQCEGYTPEIASDGEKGIERATRDYFDLVILDLTPPVGNGLEICRELRQQQVNAPILMLSVRAETMDKVLGLKIGADDYVTKPFDMRELMARVEALLRRSRNGGGKPGAVYQFGPIRVDLRRAEVFRHGDPVNLSAREFQLVKYFIEHRGAALSRTELLKEVWGYGGVPLTRTVDVHVSMLRRKLETNPSRPQYIQTIMGLGYKFFG